MRNREKSAFAVISLETRLSALPPIEIIRLSSKAGAQLQNLITSTLRHAAAFLALVLGPGQAKRVYSEGSRRAGVTKMGVHPIALLSKPFSIFFDAAKEQAGRFDRLSANGRKIGQLRRRLVVRQRST
jgi:hypothetical protein